jgi:hypothetical protein
MAKDRTAAERARRYRERKKQERLAAERELGRKLPQVKRNAQAVAEAVLEGPKRYTRVDLEEALEVGRITAAFELAAKGHVGMTVHVREWLDGDSPLRWLFIDWVSSHMPEQWEEWSARYLH